MTTATSSLPLTETAAPTEQAELADRVRQSYAAGTAIYPIGGGTSLDFGLVARVPGLGLSSEKLARVIDYPARDMTITLEAGVRMSALAEQLAVEKQRLPIDAAQAGEATLGGLIATNFSGPRRYGCGTIRDYVIGISAVDGRGVPFKAGGRVVKNVAGYDFCKLLTGSLGTLAVITQVTLKVKPVPEASAFVTCEVSDFEQAESLLAALVNSQTTPTAIELLSGPAWRDDPRLGQSSAAGCARLVVGLEGTRPEVDWMVERLASEWQAAGVSAESHRSDVEGLWNRLVEFPSGSAPLVLKISVRPSAVTSMMHLLAQVDPQCSIQAHAGNGILVARFSQFSAAQASKVLIQRIHPAAAAAGGSAVVWSCPLADELTRQAMWGIAGADVTVMQAVKKQFDPKGLLNPGRFVYGNS